MNRIHALNRLAIQNSAAQYWASGSGYVPQTFFYVVSHAQQMSKYSGSFTSPLMKPGTYTATLFEGELESGTASVSNVSRTTPRTT